jgi:hypothetical protein
MNYYVMYVWSGKNNLIVNTVLVICKQHSKLLIGLVTVCI